MRLKKINATGLKARTFSHNLTAVNLFIGRNRKGKTARAEAVKILLYGCDPDRGERNTSSIFSGTGVQIGGEWDNGLATHMSWTRSRSGGWSKGKDSTLPFRTPPELTNIAHYLKLSASERLNYVLKLAKLELDLKDAVATVKNTRVEENTADTEALLNELAENIRTIAEGVEGTGEGAMGFFERVVKELDTLVSDAGKDVKRLTATVQGFVQQAERRAENPVRPDIEDMLAAARKELADLKARQERETRELKAANERNQQRQDWQRTVDAGDPSGDVNRLTYERDELQKKITALETDLKALEQKRNDWNVRVALREKAIAAITTAEAARRELESKTAELAELKAKPNPPVDTAGEEKWKDLGRRKAEATTKRDTASDRIATLAEQLKVLELETCPHCGKQHTGKLEDALRKQAQDEQRAQNDAITALATIAPELEELEARLGREAQERMNYPAARIRTLETDIVRLQGQIDSEADAKQTLEANPPLPDPPARTELQDQIERARTAKRDVDKKLETANAARDKWLAAKAKLEANPPLPLPVDTITDEAIVLEEQRVTELDADYKRHVANLADARREEETKQDLDTAKVKQALYKAARDKFTEKRQELVEQAFGPLLKVANQFTSDFMPKLDYRDGEIGWWDGASWVEHSAASGIEEVLTGIGLAIALCQQAPYRVVILGKDELARFDRENKTRLVNRMVGAVGAGLVDQFFGVDTDREPYKDFAANPEVSIALVE